MRLSWSLLALPLALACGGGGSVGPVGTTPDGRPTYAVDLTGPVQAGDRWRMRVRHQGRKVQTQAVDIPGAEPQTSVEDVTGELVAVLEAVSVSPIGLQTETTITIESIALDGVPLPASLRPGVQVQLLHGEDDAFRIDGQPVDEATADVLDRFLSDDDTDGDEMFGTADPQPVGGTWSPDIPAATADLAAAGVTVEGGLSGEVTLVDYVQSPVPALRVAVVLRAQGIELPGLPPGSTVRESSIEMQTSALLPQSGLLVRREEHVEMDFSFVVAFTAQGANGTLSLVEHKENDITREPL